MYILASLWRCDKLSIYIFKIWKESVYNSKTITR